MLWPSLLWQLQQLTVSIIKHAFFDLQVKGLAQNCICPLGKRLHLIANYNKYDNKNNDKMYNI